MRRWFWSVGLMVWAMSARAVDITVYNDNLGLVREERTLTFKKGLNLYSLTDVAALIDPTSLHFASLSEPEGVSVLEQNFQYDLLNQQKLLQKYVGKEIEYERTLGDKRETLKGTLLSVAGPPILKVGNKIIVGPSGIPILPQLPDGFVTEPTLVWQIQAKKDGPQKCEIGYLTGGLSWKSDYVIKISPKDDRMDLNAWVTLTNTSGMSYPDAKLKLVAGDVHRAEPPTTKNAGLAGMSMRRALDEAVPGFTERGFFEYHLYTLQRPSTLKNNETKQIELVQAESVPVHKNYVYNGAANVSLSEFNSYTQTDAGYGLSSENKVWVMLEFKNSKDNGLGMPLPKGVVRVYKADVDSSLQFIGEDSIDHTPKDETVRIKMGNAFDIVGERTRTNFTIHSDKKYLTESFQITLRNHKDEAVTVKVVEPLYRWSQWKIIESSSPSKKKDSQTIEFQLPVKANGETTVTYTVKYSW